MIMLPHVCTPPEAMQPKSHHLYHELANPSGLLSAPPYLYLGSKLVSCSLAPPLFILWVWIIPGQPRFEMPGICLSIMALSGHPQFADR